MAKVISTTWKRWLIVAHLLSTVALLGGAISFLVLLWMAAGTGDGNLLAAIFEIMVTISATISRTSAIAALITGILLSVLTRWGLFNFYWIIIKEIGTLLSIALGALGIGGWIHQAATITAAEGINAWQNPLYLETYRLLCLAIVGQCIVLSALIAISIFKPWGRRGQTRNKAVVASRAPHPE